MAVVYGFAGMRDYGGQISFHPRLAPKQKRKLSLVRFPLTIRGQMLEVEVDQESVTYSLREGEGLVIRHEGEEIRLSPEAPSATRPGVRHVFTARRRRARDPTRG
jgi:alpha,alpha-trehalose phosphorylase